MGSSGGRSAWVAWLALSAAFLALSVPVVLSGRVGTSESGDELHYHLPVIRTFATSWPDINVREYNSATTPGYHVVMGLVWRATGDPTRATPRAPMQAGPGGVPPETTLSAAERAALHAFQRELIPMRLLNIAFGLAALSVVWLGARVSCGGWAAAGLALPFAFSPYVVSSSIWLTTDNIAWAAVLAALLIAWGVKPGVRSAAGAGALASLAVLMRQIHVWVAGPVVFAGALASPLAILGPKLWRRAGNDARGSGGVLTASVVAAAAPMLVVAGFAWHWGGLTPVSERIRSIHAGGVNPAAPAFALSVLACYGAFFVPMIMRRGERVRSLGAGVWTAAIVGAALALIVPTSTEAPTFENPPLRGYGWLWAVSGKFPTFADRSPLFVLLAACGGAGLMLFWRAAKTNGRGNQAIVLLVGTLAWLCAQTTNPAAWQRYFDPMLLACLAWLTALGVPTNREERAVFFTPARALPLVLALGMLALTARSIVPDLMRNTLPFDGGAPSGESVTPASGESASGQRVFTGARPTE